MARSEYTRLRDIAQKRLGRLEAQGLAVPGLAFPKLRELKTESEKAAALRAVREFVQAPTKVKEVRQAGQRVMPTAKGIRAVDPVREARRQRQRAQRARRREVLEGLTQNQRGLLKAARTLGMTINTENIPAFLEYMEYRFSQYSDSQYYLIDQYVSDFKALKKAKKENVINDFARFRADREALMEPVGAEGYTAAQVQLMWNEYINQ